MRAKKSIRARVARDKTGSLFLYFSEPLRNKRYWYSSNQYIELPQEAFPNVKRVYIRIAQYDNQKKLFKQYTHKYQ